MAHSSLPDPEQWDSFWHILQYMQVGVVLIAGWLWRRISTMEERRLALEEKVGMTDRAILDQRTEIHRDFVTKQELREIITAAVSPVTSQLKHVEHQLDRLIDNHMRKSRWEDEDK